MNDRSNGYDDRRKEQEHRALTVIEPLRMPMPAEAARQHAMTESRWRALTESVFPSAKSVTGVLMALDYCAARNLDVFKRPVHVVPMWNSKLGREVETVWPGIGELRTTAARTGQYAGADACMFGRTMKRGFSEERSVPGRGRNSEPRVTQASCPEMEFPEWAQFTVYKIVAGIRCKFIGPQVFFMETFSGEKGLRVPNTRWRQAPIQMLQKCAEAAALRMAFPEELGDSYAAEEMEGKVTTSGVPHAEFTEADRDDDRGQGEHLQPERYQGGEPGADDAEVVEDDDAGPSNEGSDFVWNDRDLADYMRNMRAALGKEQSLDRLNKMVDMERKRVASLPAAEKMEAAQIEQDARSRIDAAKQEVHSEEVDQRTAAAEPPPEQPAPVAADGEEDPYVRAFRTNVAKIEMLIDLTKFETETMDELDSKPPMVANICRRILQNRRDELKPKK